MNRKILCVDDEPNILQGYQRALHKEYEITIAEGGPEGLALIESSAPFAVVVSDMRMPYMDGVQFLARVKALSPDSVRLMLTGNADQHTAIEAVNEGNIFRFLTKPCPPEALSQALDAALEQHRLITAEKELLEETLNKSLHVMIELLSLVNPTAFYRTIRVKRLVRDIASHLGVPNLWEVEIAALLSQIGCITIPERILNKLTQNEPLHSAEKELYENHPQVAYKLIARIPRLQTAAEIIAHQNDLFSEKNPTLAQTSDPDLVRCCAQIIKVAQDFDRLMYTGQSAYEAWKQLAHREGWYLPVILEVLKGLLGEEEKDEVEIKLPLAKLKPGMVLSKPLYSTRGDLILAVGTEITLPLILRFQNFAQTGLIEPPISVKSQLNLL